MTFGGIYRIIDITLSNCINSDLRHVYILTQYKALSLNRHIREGWTSAEDTLPRRFLSERLPDGVSRGAVLPRAQLQRMIDSYYAARGWQNARPSLRAAPSCGLASHPK